MDLGYYWQLLRRRLASIVILTVLGSAIGVALAVSLPPTFRSQALLIVESEQMPGDLAASTVQTSETEALQIIRQRILSREVLLELANRLNIYEDPAATSADAKVTDLRDRIVINTAGGQVRRGNADATIVTVGFSAPNARLAAATANEVVTLILQENVEMRTSVARQTLDFFTQEVARLEQSLGRVSTQILNFQESNLEALPDSLDFRRNQQEALQERIVQLERERTALQDRRAQMVTLFQATGRTDLNPPRQSAQSSARVVLRPEEQQLEDLRAEYARLSAVLSESNPRMGLLRSQINSATRVVENLPPAPVAGGAAEEGETSVQTSLFDIQLADLEAQIAYIDDQKASTTARMEAIARTIEQTPGNAVTLAALERDYANLQEQYNQAVANKARAETGSMIEALSRGQRITVVEQAVPPAEPASPNRPLISIAGFMGGLTVGLALFGLLELLNRSVRRPRDLQTGLGIEAFATIPYMTTTTELVRRRTIALAVSLALVTGTVAALWYVDRNIRPLQPVVQRLLDKVDQGGFL